jgi:hypothetical protein
LTMGDALILHSLGVIWGANGCKRNCNTNETVQSFDGGRSAAF